MRRFEVKIINETTKESEVLADGCWFTDGPVIMVWREDKMVQIYTNFEAVPEHMRHSMYFMDLIH